MNFTYTNSNNTSCNFASYYSRNSKINVNYSLVLNKPTSIVYGKPIIDTCYSSRMLRLRILLNMLSYSFTCIILAHSIRLKFEIYNRKI